MTSIGDKIKEIISDQMGVDRERIADESSLTDDLGADSLDTVELVMAIEEKFNLEIPDDEAEKMITVRSIIDFVAKNYRG